MLHRPKNWMQCNYCSSTDIPAVIGRIPRLLGKAQVAQYLNIPLSSVNKLVVGRVIIDGRTRWDIAIIDRWLDELAGPAPNRSSSQDQSEAEIALERFLAN